MGYNNKQQEVLDYKFSEREHNLLVSAAAGSGKTRVLVDKIYDIVANQNDKKTSLSRMLIMTFTIKATYEMKSRLKERFENEIKLSSEIDDSMEKKQQRERIIREASTIQNANITTIDAFCKKILEENYLELNKEWSLYKNFDPSYKIADAKELAILYDNVLDDLLENEVYANKEKYDHFIKSFFKKNGDGIIKDILLSGLVFLSSLAWPIDEIDKWIKEIDKKEKDLKSSVKKKEEKKESDEKSDDDVEEVNENEKIYLELLKAFYQRIVAEKVKRNIYAISDYASMALDILYDDENGKKVESKFATENIKSKYDYIFVDEYQDTNTIQEFLLNAVSNGKNVFMVGDVKQSIYGFRNSNPKIFTEKFKTYGGNNGNGELITMDINYRSHYPVLNYVNELFDQIMTVNFGMINYVQDGRLGLPTKDNTDLKKEILEKKASDKKVEIHVIYDKKLEENKSDNKSNTAQKKVNAKATTSKAVNTAVSDDTKKVKAIELEAEYIAEKVEELKSEGYNYKDIVILLRNNKNNSEYYLDALSRHNIPSYADLKKGFFNRQEIKLMVDVLNVIDNPRQDIPLANVLTSSIVGLNNNQLAILKYLHIKTTGYNKTLLCDDIDYANNYLKYINVKDIDKALDEENEKKKKSIDDEAVKRKAVLRKNGELDEEKFDNEIEKRKSDLDEKLPTIKESAKKFKSFCDNYKDVDFNAITSIIGRFVTLFEEFRFKSRYIGISELINLIYDKTAIKSIMLAMNDGVMRNANLDVLYETARTYENSSFVGLFNFMRYIERIKDLEDDQGLAKINDEYDDVVRVMSIHSSKGLEFKCVILANATSKYNTKSYEKNIPVQFDSKLGIGMDYYDLDEGYCIESEKKKKIIAQKKLENKQEEMRVLYVALTRAEERLIITGSILKTGSSHLTYKQYKELETDIKKNKKIVAKAEDCNSFMELMLAFYVPNSKYCTIEEKSMNLVLDNVKKEDNLTIDLITKETNKVKEIEGKIKNEVIKKKEKNEKSELFVSVLDKLEIDEVKKSIRDDYAFSDYQAIDKTKMSVSDIKKEKHDERMVKMINKNKALKSSYYDDNGAVEAEKNKKEKNDGTEIGNAYHRYMQFYNYTKNSFDGEIGNIGDDWIKKVSEDKIKTFLESEVGREMAEAYKSETLYREQKFMKLFSITDINKYGDVFKEITNELNSKVIDEKNIIIQGIIDAFYIKEDANGKYIVLVDYKTDGISKEKINEEKLENDLIADYAVQLQIYADALESLTGLDVKKKYIYSFALNKEIEIRKCEENEGKDK